MSGQPYYTDESVTLWHGDALALLREITEGSVDAVVTDPPYGLEFMGKEWDSFKPSGIGRGVKVAEQRASEMTPQGEGHSTPGGPFLAARVDSVRVAGAPFQAWCEQWARECLRVLKPGGHMLAFGGTRTWHRLACAVEDAGFEMRDSIAWLYGSGFPKSRNLEGGWQGWGTALKPAHEPIVVARKPLAGTVAANVLAHGTGALNIDATRVPTDDKLSGSGVAPLSFSGTNHRPYHDSQPRPAVQNDAGRWPTNVLLDVDSADALDEQTGTSRSRIGKPRASVKPGDGYGMTATGAEYDDEGGASRFFPTFRYEPKAPTDERPRDGQVAHPTVKPLDLMRWLVRLVTPPGGMVLDPFGGSGTTAEACIIEGFRCVTIEREATYLPLIMARITKPLEPVLDFEDAS